MLGQLLREENLERAAWLSRRSRVHAKSIVQPHGVWRVRGPLHGSEQILSLVAIGPEKTTRRPGSGLTCRLPGVIWLPGSNGVALLKTWATCGPVTTGVDSV